MSDMYFQNLPSTSTPITAENLNKLNDIKVSSTQPNTGEKIWFKQGKNLFNKDDVRGNYIIGDSGELNSNSVWTASVKINKIKPSTPYTLSWENIDSSVEPQLEIGEYKSNGTFIRNNFQSLGAGTTSFTKNLDSNTNYIIVAYRNDRMRNIQIEQNASATSYEAYVEPSTYIKNDNGVYEEFKRDPIKMKVLDGATLNSNGNITTDIVKSKYAILSVDSNAGTILCTPFTYDGSNYWVLHFYKIADGSAASNSQINNVKVYYTEI